MRHTRTILRYVIAVGVLLGATATAHPLDGIANEWNRGSYPSPGASLAAHFEKHGREVRAANAEEYNRKAKALLNSVRYDRWTAGVTVNGFSPDVRRFSRGDRFIDVLRAADGTRYIISFGAK